MGITQQIGASSLIKPGVIDNTAARPASPYEGQVIFQKDTDQLLVWNGTAWVIPNSPAQNPQGLELITTGALSSTSTNFAGCFNATYENYRVEASKINMANGGFLAYRMLNSTTAFTSSLYYMASRNLSSVDGTGTDVLSAASYNGMGYNFQATTDGGFSCSFDFFNPFGTGRTFYTGSSSAYYSTTPLFATSTIGGGINSTNSFDGIQFFNANGNTIAGNISIYGYRK
jgi:hypothetical protein